MELWIRSQDKEDFIKVEHLGVYNEKIYANGYEDNGYCIGIYKTKERALEVLDEIQKYILLPNTDDSAYVYEMPKE